MNLSTAKTPPALPVTTFGERLRAGRLGAGLGVSEAAKAAGVSRTTWNGWERDKVAQPQRAALRKFTRVADINLDWLVNASGPAPDPKPMKDTAKKPAKTTKESDPEMPPRICPVPEIASSTVAHRKAIDIDSARTNWFLPPEVLEIGFHCNPDTVVVKRLLAGDISPFSRGDYVLVDISRTKFDESGYYLVSGLEQAAFVNVACAVNHAPEVRYQDNSIADLDKLKPLGRVMAVLRAV